MKQKRYNMNTKMYLVTAMLMVSLNSFGDFARGYFNSWASDCPLEQTGNYWSGTYQADAGGDAGLKFDLDGNWGSMKWGGTSEMAATVNQTIGTANWSQSGNLPMDVTDDAYYTFHLAGTYDWQDRSYVVMKTTYEPAEILNVYDDCETAFEGEVTLTADCTVETETQISPEEKFYILYSTDGWETSDRVTMEDGSGLTRRGKIPGQQAGTTVQYKVFSTTMPESCLTTETIYSSPANLTKIDFCMLSVMEGSYTTTAEPQTSYCDPEGIVIWDQGLIDWLNENGFTQDDINNLGNDAAATDKLYLCWLLNCNIRLQDVSNSLNVTGIQVNNNSVSITVQLVRKAPLGFIKGVLHIYGMTNLANGEWSMISEESVDFGDDNSIFDTQKTSELVTQSVTATIDASWITGKFFKAVIEFPTPEEPWEEEPEEEEPEE